MIHLRKKHGKIKHGSDFLQGRMENIILKLMNIETMTDANKGKPYNIKIGYAQNLAQLESAFQTNKKKQTADQAFCIITSMVS
ncbi:hypothetical protein RhiirC2_769991 [Rhizophagus irregularis]|uniref:Uncharacterized protein n=1 Tax=Rhizophagus irregularis TaxID=588596 RepID=A0A2N1NXP5_9GLOM|nr:hypothetical protein RhiirC2_769991 [Rhizophagus irregularis]